MLDADSNAKLLETAENAARRAGDILEDWAGRFTVSEKQPSDLVTEADVASQKSIYEQIRSVYPDHGFLGEEGLSVEAPNSPFRWIIDPLDGTSNYVHRFPFYAVSIALEIDGVLSVGVIFDPNRDEMFSAVIGKGATMNGTRIKSTDVSQLREAMVVASLPIGATGDHEAVRQLLRVMPEVQTVQRTGSAALNLSYVAAGRIEAFWSISLKPWDMAAGALLVTEAGGRVSKQNGEVFDVERPDLLTSNGTAIHEQLQRLLT